VNKSFVVLLLVLFAVSAFSFFGNSYWILEEDLNITTINYDVNFSDFPDFNSWYVSWIDGNSTYWTQTDLNSLLQIPDFNLMIINLGENQNWNEPGIDTNWMTSWDVFDANMSSYYIKITDSNNTGRLNYEVIANPPNIQEQNQLFSGTFIDVNSSTGHILIEGNELDLNSLIESHTNQLSFEDTNFMTFNDFNLWYYSQIDANNTFIKIEDTNNIGRIYYTTIADWNNAVLYSTDWNALGLTDDVNSWIEVNLSDYLKLDASNDPITGQLELDVDVDDYALIVDNENADASGIYVNIPSKAGILMDLAVRGSSVLRVAEGGVTSTAALSGTSASFSSALYAVTLRGSAGTASSPSHTFSSDTDTGLYLVSANRLGFTTGGNKRAEFTSDGDLQLVNKLQINDSSAIDSGVQLQLKGDATNNANIKMLGYSSGFFYFGFNDTYDKAAMSVSDGTTTTWDALNIDKDGDVLIGYPVSASAGAKLDVYDNSAGIASRIRQNSTGHMLDLLSGSSTVVTFERYGKITHTPSHASARSILWLQPQDCDWATDVTGYDTTHYVAQPSTGSHYLNFAIRPVQEKGGLMKIKKIVVRMTTIGNDDYITNSYITRKNANATQTTIWSNSTDYANGSSGSADYTIYDSTGIELTDDPYMITINVQNNVSNGVKIRGIKLEYDRV
jgi:hypothetical protein